ncbi:MAG: glycosyltransferase family 2 protein [Acidobacteria bacterium]|nr:glycosyltransferase family 2 protein [Acidobacteriota bacterium]
MAEPKPHHAVEPETAPTVAVAIVTWNSAGEIRACLDGLRGLPENWEVWVVDNASADATAAIVRDEFPFVRLVVNTDNRGFAAAGNQVIAATAADYVLLLNPDTETGPGDLAKALGIIETDPQIGLLGVRLCNPDGSLQRSCFHFPTVVKNFVDNFGLFRLYAPERAAELFAGDFFDHLSARDVDWVMGAFMLVRRAAIDRAGPIPEDYFMFAEDMDFCRRIADSGYVIRFSPEPVVKHQLNRSAGQRPAAWRIERTTLSKHLFAFKNYGILKGRLIQLTDLAGICYRILRVRRREPDSPALAEWRAYRRVIIRACLMSKRAIAARLRER